MDFASIIGLVIACASIIGAIFTGGDIVAFIDVPSVIVVIFGMIGVTFIKWPMETLKTLIPVTMKVFFAANMDPNATIEQIGELAETARRESVFALEKVEVDDPFLKKAMTLAADNRPPEVISQILQMEIDAMENRHRTGADIFGGMADDGPAMGMLGTLIGLVIMLGNLSDQAAIGPAMAVALLTTFYGAFIANVLAGPFKNKIAFRSGQELVKMSIILAGTLGIVAGENPRLIKEKLSAFIPPSKRVADGGESEG